MVPGVECTIGKTIQYVYVGKIFPIFSLKELSGQKELKFWCSAKLG
jgi:hypothetical protein